MPVAGLIPRASAPVFLAFLALAMPACSPPRDALARAERAFAANEHERALALLQDLDADLSRLTPAERAQYCYLRGMTDYRIGYRADARHWLALAKAYDETSAGVLPADWRARAAEALREMNDVVYAEGIPALSQPASRDETGP